MLVDFLSSATVEAPSNVHDNVARILSVAAGLLPRQSLIYVCA